MSQKLKAIFTDLLDLNGEVVGGSAFQYPRLELSAASLALRRRRQKIAGAQPEPPKESQSERKSIGLLLDAITRATRKLEFAKTLEEEWNDSLVFADTRAIRRSHRKTYLFRSSTKKTWSDGDAINQTIDVANDWFVRVLMANICEGVVNRHTQVIVGDKGCGKSTLLKYLITKNSVETKRKKIVFSRFEFMKFIQRWKKLGNNTNEALRNYLSYIQSRDLFLDHFFDLHSCAKYSIKFPFVNEVKLDAEITSLMAAMKRLAPVVGMRVDDDTLRVTIETLLHAARLGNAELMRELRKLSSNLRILLVGALWEDKTVVTVFDGLDSLDVHDALQNSDQWKMVKYLVENRAELSSPTILRLNGEVNDADSILVLRRNTVAQLEKDYTLEGKPIEFGALYSVAPVDGLTATVSVMRRAARLLNSNGDLESREVDNLAFDLMRIAQRTMIALSRNASVRVPSGLLYNLFEGDLREQFRFLSVIFEWSVKDMLSLNYLDSHEHFDALPKQLIEVLASSRGNDFLARKSYRIVELLLSPEGGAFENAALTVSDESGLLEDSASSIPIQNVNFVGHLDNIFNYLDRTVGSSIDDHAFLVKIRAVQLLSGTEMGSKDFISGMSNTFGYSQARLKDLIIFLLQTEFLVARVVFHGGKYNILLSASAKGRFCVDSLIYNLAYLENVFHSTLFPTVLVSHIEDRERSASVSEWAAASIRNAYILLTYFSLIEKNLATGKAVPDSYRLLPKIQQRVTDTVLRMIEPRAAGDRIEGEPEKIAARALELIKKTVVEWKRMGALV
jgi:ABC-type oligopeptide transport system ATPase subunit